MIASRSGRCVVFDLDDTLFDEIDYVRSGYYAVASALRAAFGADCQAALLNRAAADAFDDAFQSVARDFALPNGSVELMIETYRTHRPVLRPRLGVLELLEQLKAVDGVLGCITDGRSVAQRAKIDALGVGSLLDVLLISEETGHNKLQLHNFEEMMRRVTAAEFWYVADNCAKDFVIPNTLRWRTLGLRNACTVRRVDAAEWPPHHQPQIWVDDFAAAWRDVFASVEAP